MTKVSSSPQHKVNKNRALAHDYYYYRTNEGLLGLIQTGKHTSEFCSDVYMSLFWRLQIHAVIANTHTVHTHIAQMQIYAYRKALGVHCLADSIQQTYCDHKVHSSG